MVGLPSIMQAWVIVAPDMMNNTVSAVTTVVLIGSKMSWQQLSINDCYQGSMLFAAYAGVRCDMEASRSRAKRLLSRAGAAPKRQSKEV
jgi:hypothetical protein